MRKILTNFKNINAEKASFIFCYKFEIPKKSILKTKILLIK